MRSVISAFALLLGTCVMGEPSEDPEIRADYFVSVDGNDSWSGKFSLPNREGTDGPLASLAAARDTVRRNGDRSADQDVTVLIRGGVFRIDRTVVFGLEDSAAPGHSIVYTAYPGEKPVFSSGVEIGPWVKAHIPPDRLPEQAVGKVWIADIPKELNSFHTLYDRRTRLPRARSAGSTPRGEPNTPGSSRTRLLFPRGMLKEWPNLNDVEIVIRPQVQFTMNILTLESVDESECVAETSIPASYPLTNPGRKGWTLYPKMPNTLWVENVLEVLDKPGEWVVDTNAGKIFLWPGIEKPGRNIVAPRLREFVRVEGDIDFEGERDEPVRGLIFRGLTFTHGDRDVWTGEDAGLQHDWALYDKGDALIRFRGAENCAV